MVGRNDDVRVALERELEFYERAGNTARAAEVRASIKARRTRGARAVDVELAVEQPPENAAERTDGVSTDDLGALTGLIAPAF